MKKALLIYLSFLPLFGFAQWVQVNQGIKELDPTLGALLIGSNESYIFALSKQGYRSKDNGNNWEEIKYPGGIGSKGFYFKDKFFLGLNSSQACIYYTENNGDTWTAAQGAPTASVIIGFESNATYVFAYTSNKGIYRSSDNGLSWSESNSGLSSLNVTHMLVTESKIYASTMGGVFVSSNNGDTWTVSNTGIVSWDLAGKYIWKTGGALYYTGQGGGFYESKNEGASWANWTQKPPVFGLGLNEIYTKGKNVYIETRHFGGGGLRDSVYQSSDNGNTWKNISGNLAANNLNATGIIEHNNYTFISYTQSNTLGIFRRESPTGFANINSLMKKRLVIFPNPASETIAISSEENMVAAEYEILDVREKPLIKGVLANTNLQLIDISNLIPGVYFVKIKSDNHSIYRIIKQ